MSHMIRKLGIVHEALESSKEVARPITNIDDVHDIVAYKFADQVRRSFMYPGTTKGFDRCRHFFTYH
jgi:hypothetical protein